MIFRNLLLLTALFPAVLAEEPTAPEIKPSVTRLEDGSFQIGAVTFDQKTREMRFPGQVNMTDGLLEYLIVHENGKVHESLISTKISPSDLNLAFKLLRYPTSAELYPLPNETGGTSANFPDVPADVKAAARVDISVEWQADGKTKRTPVNDWVQHAVKGTAMPAGPWVYGGSEVHEGKFIAETSGDVAAIYLSPAAMINYPGEDNGNDDVWIVFPKRVPELGTKVTVIIAPHQKPKPSQP